MEEILADIQSRLPIKDPVLIFSIVLFVILLAPVVLNRFRIPGIIGLIVSGVIIGPNGFNLLLRDSGVVLFGTVGLLYIMFVAGLEIDLNDFKKNRNKSIIFGIATFSIPMLMGTTVGYYFLDFSLTSSILLASMFASHTLLAYPIISRLGITKAKAVNITVGGTIITDTAALLVLAIIIGSTRGELDAAFWVQLIVSMILASLIVLGIVPRVARWFFKNYETEGDAQYIFVLAIVFFSAFLLELAGVEPIIGAFLAGLALNRLIPHTSALMNRIEFVGNALFIPFFLISVGMLVDLKVIFTGTQALVVAGTMITIAMLAKYLAAQLTRLIYGMSAAEGLVIFGLSNAQAAATLAAVLVGFNVGLLNENVLNGTILMILVTSLVSSFVTEKAGKELAIVESQQVPDIKEIQDRILVPIANPQTMTHLIDFAFFIKDPKVTEPIYTLHIVKDDEQAEANVLASNKLLDSIKKYAASSNNSVQVLTRVDMNPSNGILRAAKDLLITDLVIGWNEKAGIKEWFFGNLVDSLVAKTEKMIFLPRIVQPVSTTRKLVLLLPSYAEFEKGFVRLVKAISFLAKQTSADILLYSTEKTFQRLKYQVSELKVSINLSHQNFDEWDDLLIIAKDVTKDDMIMLVSARANSISYQIALDKAPRRIFKYFSNNNMVVVYPEQNPDYQRAKGSFVMMKPPSNQA